MKKTKNLKTRVRLFTNMGGNIPSGNFPGRSLMGGHFPGGSFPDTNIIIGLLVAYSSSREAATGGVL